MAWPIAERFGPYPRYGVARNHPQSRYIAGPQLIDINGNITSPMGGFGHQYRFDNGIGLRGDLMLQVLLAAGADPNRVTPAGAATGSFKRDCRTRGETPLHRAAAFGTENTIRLLLDAGARADAHDANGDSPLTWASWYQRPVEVLRLLLFGEFRIHPQYAGLRANLLGRPHGT